MHGCATQILVIGYLAGGHLHERRTAQEHLGAALDHDDVVAHPRDVRTPGGRVAEDESDRRYRGRRAPRQVAEHPPAGDEDLRLGRQVGATGLDEAHQKAGGSRGRCLPCASTCAS